MSEKYGFVYIWRDRKHNRYYIGSHWGTENDGYICSSRWMRKAYNRRREDFKRKILSKIYTNRVDLLNEEQRWFDMIKPHEFKIKYYNINPKVLPHWSSDERKAMSIKEKLSETAKKNHSDPVYREKYLKGFENRNNVITEETKEKRRQSMIKKMAEKFPVEERYIPAEKNSIEHKEKLSKKSKEMWGNKTHDELVEISKRAKEFHTGKKHRLGHKSSPEHIEKIANANRGKKRTPEQIQKMSESKKGKKHTEEQKLARSIKTKEMWAARKSGLLPMPNYNK